MAVTVTTYGLFLQSLTEGRFSTLVDEVWCMLVTNAYTFNQNGHKFKSAITGEIVGSGYSAGGQKVTLGAPVFNTTLKQLSLPAGNLAWPSVIFSGVVGAVVYGKPQGAPTNAMPLISYVAFGESIGRSSEAFYLNWPTTGIAKLVVP